MKRFNNELLKTVYETGFALDDVALYLDTHPTDPAAMNFYHQISNANREAVQKYEMTYGPLMYNGVKTDYWSWLNGPWPWEGGTN